MEERKRRKRKRRTGRLRILLSLLLVFSGLAYVFYGRLFPMEYEETIAVYAQQYGVDPFLVYAVIHTESRFREDALSPAGAVGLMQVTPDTGLFIASRLEIPSYTEEMLRDPEMNIRMGIYYLSYLEERFERVETRLAAYNAGPNRVQGWLEDEGISPGGVLPHIPFEETRNYVERVLQREKIYRLLYFYK